MFAAIVLLCSLEGQECEVVSNAIAFENIETCYQYLDAGIELFGDAVHSALCVEMIKGEPV